MTQQYTKGPWEFTDGNAGYEIHSKNLIVAHITTEPNAVHEDGNARLIAAAPELLEALEKALEMLEELKIESGRGIDWGEEDAFRMGEWFERDEIAAMKIAGAAIAKAKGEPQ